MTHPRGSWPEKVAQFAQTGLLGLVLVPRSPREQQISRRAKICCEIAVIRCAPDPSAQRSCVSGVYRNVTPLRCSTTASQNASAARRRARESDEAPHLISLVVRYSWPCPSDQEHLKEETRLSPTLGLNDKPDALRTFSEPPGDSGVVPEGAVAAHLPRERRATCTAPAAPGHGTADWIAVPLQFFYAPRSQRCF